MHAISESVCDIKIVKCYCQLVGQDASDGYEWLERQFIEDVSYDWLENILLLLCGVLNDYYTYFDLIYFPLYFALY